MKKHDTNARGEGAAEKSLPGKGQLPLRAAAYIRVSTESSDQENSYEMQSRYFIRLLADHPGWICAGVYSDYGISGTGGQNRIGFRRLLRHCAQGKIDHIVCKSISRFSRNTADFIAALTMLRENHVTIFFEKEGLNTQNASNEFILTTLAAVAQEESRSISMNVRWAIRRRYPKGLARNFEIYGYRFRTGDEDTEQREEGSRIRQVEIVEEEAKIVRRIFQEADEGERYIDIARRLNLEGIPAPGQGKDEKSSMEKEKETGWTGAMVSRMLRLERYCGDALLQKTYIPDYLTHKSRKNNGELPQYMVRNHHPGFISREQFARVQELRKYNTEHFSNKNEKQTHGFSGMLICGHCGRSYNIRNQKNHPIWFCPAASLNNGKDICHAEKVYEEQAVRMFRKAFIDRFHLLMELFSDDVRTADIISGRYGQEEDVLCRFSRGAESFISRICRRLEYIQEMDFIERDLAYIREKTARCQESCEKPDCRRQALQLGQGAEKSETVSRRPAYLEAYWERLESTYEDREKTLEWLRGLPEGQEGTVAFLNGLDERYLNTFVLSITVHDPFRYSVHWFDDVWTDVKMYSNVQDYRRTAGCCGDWRGKRRCTGRK